MKSEPGVNELARAVADGSAVDWDLAAKGTSSHEQRALIEQLRMIARIAGGGRSRNEPPAPVRRRAARETARQSVGRWGDLILIEEVGRGSFGTVYRGHDPRLDRAVAVKLLQRRSSTTDEQIASRLLNEGRTLARVRHANIVAVYGAGEHRKRVGLWMEFIRGLTLEQMLVSHGPFSASEAGLVGHDLCGALAAVHQAGLVHRDVKAQNVMREEGGRLVLMDFGAGQTRLEASAAASGRIVGTPLYLAPELLTGAEATIRSDIYSLGVLLFHLVTNDFPVNAATFEDLVAAHARREIRPLQDLRPGLPAPFVRIVQQATHSDAAKRFADAGRMAAALARLLGTSVNSVAAPRLRTSARRIRRTAQSVSGHRAIPSVAVLPFVDMSAAKDQECFCDGLTEEIINALAQISGLRVAARASSFQFRGQARDVHQIGDALNVATVLDGSVRKEGDRLRITVELIGAADGYHLWSRHFDRHLVDVFAVQDEIAAAVVSALTGKLTAESDGVRLAPRSKDYRAYEAYLEGRYHWNKRTEEELQKSVGCFELAIGHDPDYAPAYAGMADAYVTLATYGSVAPADAMPRAMKALNRALAIDAGSSEAYTCRACVRSVYEWAWTDAEQDFRRAIDAGPGYPTAHHWYAINHLVPLRRFDEASKALLRALELDPLALAVKTSVGMMLYFAGQYDDAARALARTIALDESFAMAHAFLGSTYTELGRHAEALKELETAIRLSGRHPETIAALGYLYGVSGNTKAARRVLGELTRLARQRYVSPGRFAQVHLALGERKKALDRLQDARVGRAADLAWLAVRPVFASLRGEPGFDALLKQMALPA